ncbi:MAG: type I methionyl aminopeptidase [Clostridia bacterium]|nr:type I methionyl aminopeptidase [Clostridia bacterium]
MVYLKTPEQIETMRKVCKIVHDSIEYAGENLRAGMTTRELDALIHKYIVTCGANPTCLGYEGYPAASCISVNEVVVHGIPGDRVIKDGDIVSVDVCADKYGFVGDSARTFLVGDVSEDKKKLVKVAEECFWKALEGLGPGTPLFDIGAAVQEHAEANGYSVVRALTGHGIGREMHEDPNVLNYGKRGTGMRLRAGMVICIEPMINMGTYKVNFDKRDGWTVTTADGKPSAHYENTVAITEDGYDILTL